MKVIVGETAGFCYGVDRAVSTTIKELKEKQNKKIYCLGELVHNKQVIERLEKQNAKTVEDLDEIEEKLKDILEECEIEVRRTICNATKLRQEETEKISKEVQYMIIIGGKDAKNIKELKENMGIGCMHCIIAMFTSNDRFSFA